MPPIHTKPSANGRSERLAANIADLTRIEPTIRALLLHGKLDENGGAIWVDRSRVDECAVAFSCDLLTTAGEQALG
jgi:hypothetical protein